MTDIENIGREVLRDLENGWNQGSGALFGERFSDDADFVDIRGKHHRGKSAIAAGHQGIFDSIYRGSRIRYELTSARSLSDDIILVHSTADFEAPSGPLAGTHRATQSLVLGREGATWKVQSFHNTVQA